MVGIGATTNHLLILKYMKKPKAYATGVITQLVVVPCKLVPISKNTGCFCIGKLDLHVSHYPRIKPQGLIPQLEPHSCAPVP